MIERSVLPAIDDVIQQPSVSFRCINRLENGDIDVVFDVALGVQRGIIYIDDPGISRRVWVEFAIRGSGQELILSGAAERRAPEDNLPLSDDKARETQAGCRRILLASRGHAQKLSLTHIENAYRLFFPIVHSLVYHTPN